MIISQKPAKVMAITTSNAGRPDPKDGPLSWIQRSAAAGEILSCYQSGIVLAQRVQANHIPVPPEIQSHLPLEPDLCNLLSSQAAGEQGPEWLASS
jgi:hypothetical protein